MTIGKFRIARLEHGWPTFETSAKAGSGVEEMFLALAEEAASRRDPNGSARRTRLRGV